jgi:Protein of unknown function (DUF2501)
MKAAMRKLFASLACIAAMEARPQAATAQMSAPPISSALPGVSKISVANAAGVLKYCDENGLVSGVSVDAMLTGFVTKSDQTSKDYIVGASGQILGDAGKNFSISRAPGYLQSQACDMVLERAKTFSRQPR